MLTIAEQWCQQHRLDREDVVSVIWWRWFALAFIWVKEGEMTECVVRWPVWSQPPIS